MNMIEYIDSNNTEWQTVTEGVEKAVLRAAPGENRVLIRMAAGTAFPIHQHHVPDEVFVVSGVYTDPGVEGGRPFGAGAYLYYPADTEHQATTPSGCTILVWNSNTPAR